MKKVNQEFLKTLESGKCGLFHTPKDFNYIQNWIERHNGAEKAHLYTLQGMILNLIIDKLESEESK